jgi:hypothetical protein
LTSAARGRQGAFEAKKRLDIQGMIKTRLEVAKISLKKEGRLKTPKSSTADISIRMETKIVSALNI